jgi:hypothetical protein
MLALNLCALIIIPLYLSFRWIIYPSIRKLVGSLCVLFAYPPFTHDHNLTSHDICHIQNVAYKKEAPYPSLVFIQQLSNPRNEVQYHHQDENQLHPVPRRGSQPRRIPIYGRSHYRRAHQKQHQSQLPDLHCSIEEH